MTKGRVRGEEGWYTEWICFCSLERNDKIIVLYTPIDGWRTFCPACHFFQTKMVICKCPMAKTADSAPPIAIVENKGCVLTILK